jgi:glycosyltransferase involved in cell wall biosynthesis
MVDLPILRAFRKKIVVTFMGCDIRQADFCRTSLATSACVEGGCPKVECNSTTDAFKRRKAERFSRFAHKIFAYTPDLLHFLPDEAELLPCFSVDLAEWRPVVKSPAENFVILHAPTNRAIKGTRYVMAAVEKLKSKHKNVELRLVENIPHNQVKELYSQADVAIDQLLVGWYGVFSVELMALGKPVVCYIREGDLGYVPTEMKQDLPIINASPYNLYETLDRVLEERHKLRLIGEQSRAYVEKWHDPMKTALRMKNVYESLFAR